jgi:hypothetical protein
VKTQFVMLKLTGLLSVSMVREKVESVIFEEELLLWGTKIHATNFDRTFSREDASMEWETPKKQKDEWETAVMDEGEHPFPFEFELPAKSMPSSIDVCPILTLLITVWQGVNYLYYSLYPSTTSNASWSNAK